MSGAAHDLEAPLLRAEEQQQEELTPAQRTQSDRSLVESSSSNGDLLRANRQDAGAPSTASTSRGPYGTPGDGAASDYSGPVLCAFHFHKNGERNMRACVCHDACAEILAGRVAISASLAFHTAPWGLQRRRYPPCPPSARHGFRQPQRWGWLDLGASPLSSLTSRFATVKCSFYAAP